MKTEIETYQNFAKRLGLRLEKVLHPNPDVIAEHRGDYELRFGNGEPAAAPGVNLRVIFGQLCEIELAQIQARGK